MTTPNLQITENASRQIALLQEKEGKSGIMLRVTVLGGGCSGFQYAFDFDDTVNADDFTFENNGATVVADATSMEFLQGAIIDYEQTMVKSAFKIKNPNATAACGCGKSFGV
ncbi:MAG: iron-sulfur cluster insertion protein ErpA [Alphaproteobacteria bacterium]|nr:iron-sulfur cluster insertion protein ErpA [Alphaproteobacteria bacterium]